MLLFLTRETFFRFSMEALRRGDMEASSLNAFSEDAKREGEVGSRSCQKARGELARFLLHGDESNGEFSRANIIDCAESLALLFQDCDGMEIGTGDSCIPWLPGYNLESSAASPWG